MSYDTKIWFNIEPQYKEVDKETFVKFLENYPRKLDRDVYAVCDPPHVTYNDFELANRWPYSIVASTHLYSDEVGDYWYEPPEERVYKILINYEVLFNNRTGHKE